MRHAARAVGVAPEEIDLSVAVVVAPRHTAVLGPLCVVVAPVAPPRVNEEGRVAVEPHVDLQVVVEPPRDNEAPLKKEGAVRMEVTPAVASLIVSEARASKAPIAVRFFYFCLIINRSSGTRAAGAQIASGRTGHRGWLPPTSLPATARRPRPASSLARRRRRRTSPSSSKSKPSCSRSRSRWRRRRKHSPPTTPSSPRMRTESPLPLSSPQSIEKFFFTKNKFIKGRVSMGKLGDRSA